MGRMFIYVFSEHDKRILKENGYVLFKEDPKNYVFIFKNDDTINFSKLDIGIHAFSDVLTF